MLDFKRYDQFQKLLPQGIQGLWSLACVGESECLSIIPDGHPEIVIPVMGSVRYQIGNRAFSCKVPSLIGQISEPTSFFLEKGTFLFHLKVYPYFLGQLADQSSYDIANSCEPLSSFSVDLTEIFLSFAEGIVDRSDLDANIYSLLQQLQRWDHPAQPPLLLADQLNKYKLIKNLDLKQTTLLKTKFSNRYLEKLYKKEIGLSPKKFYKILRIKKASLLMSHGTNASLSSISNVLGYYDLSHFYKDFKSLSDQCPKNFMQNQKALHKNQDYLNQWDFS